MKKNKLEKTLTMENAENAENAMENTENAVEAVTDKEKEIKEAYIWECLCDGFATPQEAKQAFGNAENRV